MYVDHEQSNFPAPKHCIEPSTEVGIDTNKKHPRKDNMTAIIGEIKKRETCAIILIDREL